MIIERKKAWNSLATLLAFLFSVFLLVISLMGIFSERGLMEKFGFSIFLILSIVVLKTVFNSLYKIFSDSPEFEMTTDFFIIYDHDYYDRIPFSEILGCEVFHQRRGPDILGLAIKLDSKIESNSNFFKDLLYRSDKNSKMVFLNLDFADINHDHLVRLINEKINN